MPANKAHVFNKFMLLSQVTFITMLGAHAASGLPFGYACTAFTGAGTSLFMEPDRYELHTEENKSFFFGERPLEYATCP
jgi:hypothetical protein